MNIFLFISDILAKITWQKIEKINITVRIDSQGVKHRWEKVFFSLLDLLPEFSAPTSYSLLFFNDPGKDAFSIVYMATTIFVREFDDKLISLILAMQQLSDK